MTKMITLLVSIAFTALPVLGAFRDIKEVCKQTPDIGLFGQFLDANPDIYAYYAGLNEATIYVPSDEAMQAHYKQNGTVFRRATAEQTANSQYMTEKGVNAVNNARRASASNGGSVFVTGGSSSGSGSSSRKRQVPFNTTVSKGTGVSVYTGLGKTTQILFGDIQCTQGLVQVVDDLFTHPEPVTNTLPYIGATKFLDSINAANLGSTYHSLSNITIFAPVNSGFTNQSTLSAAAVQYHVVEGPALYSPSLKDGDVLKASDGNNIYITVTNGEYYANCVHLVQLDSIVSNGVVHGIEKPITPLSSPPPCFSGPVQFTGAGSVGKAINMMAIISTVCAAVGLLI